jgi:cobalt-precorrin-5B (C1)-methyltransferase
MIREEVERVKAEFSYSGGLEVEISVPGGAELATHTFNPHLGVEGGISILGTSGLVEPMRREALVDTLVLQLRQLRAEGTQALVAAPGNYGLNFVLGHPVLSSWPRVRYGNHVGELLDHALGLGFTAVLLVGHVGKLVKLAGGVMDTDSRVADCRLDFLALAAARAGVAGKRLDAILASSTLEAGLDLIPDPEERRATLEFLLARIDFYLERRTGGKMATGALLFSNRQGHLGTSPGGLALLASGAAGD